MSNWAHSPAHYFSEQGTYFITAATLYKTHFWDTPEKLDYLEGLFFELMNRYPVKVQAWVFLRNHYHIMIFADGKNTVPEFITEFHRLSATWLNTIDKTPERKVWFQYWDKRITYQKSYLARLKYINKNPFHHKYVELSKTYRWCSQSWFDKTCSNAFRKTVDRFKIDKLNIYDDF